MVDTPGQAEVTGDANVQVMQAYPQYRFALPRGATDLLLVRHGESTPMQPSGFPMTETGQADPELSAEGHRQAAAVCARLAGVGVDAVYVSSLRRTQQTAQALAATIGVLARVEPDLREIHLGEWEGGEFRRRAITRDPRMMELLRGGDWSLAPGAERPEVFAGRVRAALERIHATHPNQRVAAFCHGGVVGQIFALATGARPLAFMACDNSAISQVILHGGHWFVRRFNDTEHLGPAFTSSSPPPQ